MEKQVEEIIHRESLRWIFDHDINGRNFILENSESKAMEMSHIGIYYADREKVHLVVFEEDLKPILERKLNERRRFHGDQG